MYSIDVDFQVFKALTNLRKTEATTYNDVLLDILKIDKEVTPTNSTPATTSNGDWLAKGVRFPAGTEFRAPYKGQTITGRIESGALVVNGNRFDSPSSAAVFVTKNSVNGWRFWECKLPGQPTWRSIETLRK